MSVRASREQFERKYNCTAILKTILKSSMLAILPVQNN